MATQPYSFEIAQAFCVRGQAVLVTGAGGYIGGVIAEAFAANGAKVLLSDLPGSPIATLAQRLRDQGLTAIEQGCDLRVPEQLRGLITAAETHFGGLDTLVHCGAVPLSWELEDEQDEQFDKLFQTNLRSTWLLIKYAREMFIRRGGGAVINIASVNGHRAMFHGSLYAATKAGMLSMTREMSSELGENKIRVNTVSPGVIAKTSARFHDLSQMMHPPYRERLIETFGAEAKQGATNSQPLPIGGLPIDVAMACLYLASPAARFVSGADILVDGGFLNAVYSDHDPPKPNRLWDRVRQFLREIPDEGWVEGKPPVWLKKVPNAKSK